MRRRCAAPLRPHVLKARSDQTPLAALQSAGRVARPGLERLARPFASVLCTDGANSREAAFQVERRRGTRRRASPLPPCFQISLKALQESKIQETETKLCNDRNAGAGAGRGDEMNIWQNAPMLALCQLRRHLHLLNRPYARQQLAHALPPAAAPQPQRHESADACRSAVERCRCSHISYGFAGIQLQAGPAANKPNLLILRHKPAPAGRPPCSASPARHGPNQALRSTCL